VRDLGKVIFLDFDGVLNQGRPFIQGGPRGVLKTYVDPATVERVNRIVEETGAYVVVSSTWRIGKTRAEMQEQLAGVGFKGTVIGRTDDVVPCTLHFGKTCAEAHRGTEIGMWLHDHRSCTGFVIIDDESDMGVLAPWLVQTDDKVGITDDDVEAAIKLLKEGVR
jgi:hypothetical protein